MSTGEREEQTRRGIEKSLEQFVSLEEIYKHTHRGNTIFIGTGCGEPRYLVQSPVDYIESRPKAFLDAKKTYTA